ncbi:MAG: roadblock/LC7 domain-containing protein [Actinomycetota bacterium]
MTGALDVFVNNTTGVTEAVVVSSDGFVLAATAAEHSPGTEQLAAIIAGMTSLSQGASDLYGMGAVRQVIVEMAEGYLFVMSTAGGSCVGALTAATSDMGNVGYEMTLLTQAMADLLTPDVVDTLKNALAPRG